MIYFVLQLTIGRNINSQTMPICNIIALCKNKYRGSIHFWLVFVNVSGQVACNQNQYFAANCLYYLTIFYMDLSSIQSCPVLRPTFKQFDNFRQYMQGLDRLYKKEYGMVKIIPPKNWIPHVRDYRKKLQDLVVNGPIQQNTFGKSGIYECLHIPRKSMSFVEFRQKSQDLDKITDNLSTNQIEEMFWKNVTFSAPLYGADLLNSLMDSTSKGWNLNALDSVLRDSLSNKVKGINTPYCYLGSWKAFFCWHTEDLDLSGVNLIHEGKSKFWYAISHQDKKIIQSQAQKLFPQHFTSCKQFLRHKTILINPYYLKKKYPNLRISKVEHKQHQIIAVFGGSYHCGFNFGFNVAEAINYATKDWLRQITEVKSCKCLKSSVKASEYEIYKNLVTNANINSTKQFLAFQEYIFKKAEAEDSEQELEEAKVGVSKQFSKKIKKSKKLPTKITFKNEEYDIQNWAQCEKCKLWRVVKRIVKQNDYFECKQSQKQCYKRQKIDKKVFTIQG